MAGRGRVSPSQEGSGWQPVGSGLECGSPTSASSRCRPGLILPATRGQHGGTGRGRPVLGGVKVTCRSVWDTTSLGRSLPV